MAPSRMPPFRDTGCPLCAVVLAAQLLFAAAVPLQDQSRPAFGEDNGEEPVAGRLGTTASRPGGLKNMRWMHIPKAGTSFGTVMYHYACPQLPDDAAPAEDPNNKAERRFAKVFLDRYPVAEYCVPGIMRRPYYGHYQLGSSKSPDDLMKGAIVGLFRDPRRRLLSAWATHGRPGTKFHPPQLRDYIKMHRGCQAKMVLGIDNCETPTRFFRPYFNITATQMKLVADRLNNHTLFPFIGLTDHYNESVQLFHAQYGGKASSAEWGNTRKGKHENQIGRQKPFVTHPALSLITPDADEADWFVYETVRDRFASDLLRFGIAVPTNLYQKPVVVLPETTSVLRQDLKTILANLQELQYRESEQDTA